MRGKMFVAIKELAAKVCSADSLLFKNRSFFTDYLTGLHRVFIVEFNKSLTRNFFERNIRRPEASGSSVFVSCPTKTP